MPGGEVPTTLQHALHLSMSAPRSSSESLAKHLADLFCIQCMQNGQQYKPHEDYFHDKVNARPENGGQRIATVLMYLCAV
jgi:2OG-Fe(II) oxygenase superfamily